MPAAPAGPAAGPPVTTGTWHMTQALAAESASASAQAATAAAGPLEYLN